MKNNSILKCFLAFLLLTVLIAPAHAAGDWASTWNYTTDGGVTGLAIGDIDKDGFPEIAVATTSSTLLQGGITGYSSWLYVLDKEGNLKWTKGGTTFGAKITTVMTGDLEGDGNNEVMVGSGSYVHFFDGKGTEEQSIHIGTYGFEVTNIIIADVNNDKINEVVVAGHTAQSGAVYIYNNKKQWLGIKTPDMSQSLTAFYAGDLNNDGKYEYVVGTTGNSPTSPAFIYEYNSDGTTHWTYKTSAAVTSLNALDIDGDKLPEVLAGGNGFVVALDGTGTMKKNVTLSGTTVNKLLLYDVDKNGQEEIIASGNYLYLLDKNLVKKWVSSSVFTQTYAVKLYDLNDDGFPEIIVGANGIYIYNKDGTETDTIYPGSTVKDFALADLSGDDYPEIVMGLSGQDSNGKIIGRVHDMSSQQIAKGTDATGTYNKALKLFNSGNLTGAEEYAKEAQKQFNDLGDNQNKNNVTDLLNKIIAAEKGSNVTKNEADTYYDKAVDAYSADSTTHAFAADALANANIARAKYLQIGDIEDVKRCDDIINPTTEIVTIQANVTFTKAQSYFENRSYNDAFVYANKSIELFNLLHDADGVQKSKNLLQQAQSAGGIDPKATGQTKQVLGDQTVWLYGAGAFFIILLVFAFTQFKKKKKK